LAACATTFRKMFPCQLTKRITLAKKAKLSFQEEKQIEKVMKSISKKSKKENLEIFYKAISEGNRNTPCICVQRSEWNFLMNLSEVISLNSEDTSIYPLPHFWSCKIWRWPNLKSHLELQSIETCKHGFEKNTNEVCIQPYHYEMIQAPSLPPVLVPKTNDPIPSREQLELLNLEANIVPKNATYSEGLQPSVNFPIDPPSSPDYISEEGDTTDRDPRSISNSPSQSSYTPEQAELAYQAQIASDLLDAQPVAYTEPPYWCSISYYEMNQRVGELFHATQPSLTVDGFTDPSNAERFCLGILSNVNRNRQVEQARQHIGKGVRLYYIGGEVFAECLSGSAIFVQSPNCNKRYGWHPATVVKIPPGLLPTYFSGLKTNIF